MMGIKCNMQAWSLGAVEKPYCAYCGFLPCLYYTTKSAPLPTPMNHWHMFLGLAWGATITWVFGVEVCWVGFIKWYIPGSCFFSWLGGCSCLFCWLQEHLPFKTCYTARELPKFNEAYTVLEWKTLFRNMYITWALCKHSYRIVCTWFIIPVTWQWLRRCL